MNARLSPAPPSVSTTARESILLDCQWSDPAWTLAPTNLLEQARPKRIHWDFELPSGRLFTDPAYAALLVDWVQDLIART